MIPLCITASAWQLDLALPAQVMTGHSLGRNKLEHLLASGARGGGRGPKAG